MPMRLVIPRKLQAVVAVLIAEDRPTLAVHEIHDLATQDMIS
jgi:hypothetical protein